MRRALLGLVRSPRTRDTVYRIPRVPLCQISRLNHFTTMADESKPVEATPKPVEAEETELPKLSAAEFRVYNRMAEHMDFFHNNFRRSWKLLYGACESNKRPSGMSIRQFLSVAEDFCHHLHVHHSIEEQHIFPILAKKMPAFKKELELLSQHKQIHKGLEKLQDYVEACRTGEQELRLTEMKGIMDTFGKVLWEHLDDEVKELRAENMRKYWSQDEMRRLPI